jgi:hypothetical protein
MKPVFIKKHYFPLNSVFGKEPNFSKWLANEGKEYLEEELNIELVSLGTEIAPNNRKRVDIVMEASTPDGNSKIIIENQYGQSDDNHFSKLITYALTNGAKYAVWICERLHEEHKIAIDRLNNIIDDSLKFYVFEAKVESIGDDNNKSFILDSRCTPNEESKIKSNSDKVITDLMEQRKKFWSGLSNMITNNDIGLKARKPSTDHWYNVSIGSKDAVIAVNAITRDRKIRIDLWIPDNKDLFDKLYSQKETIENEIGLSLI